MSGTPVYGIIQLTDDPPANQILPALATASRGRVENHQTQKQIETEQLVKSLPPGSAKGIEETMELSIRPLKATDRPACRRLFEDTVHRVNCRDYSPEQIQAWAPRGATSANWEQRFEGKEAWVACLSGSVVGFADLDADGYLDRLFVSADHQRQGIARRLLAQLVQNAKSRGMASIRTEASITARPFFEAMGFRVLASQQVLCRGVPLTNFRMELRLD